MAVNDYGVYPTPGRKYPTVGQKANDEKIQTKTQKDDLYGLTEDASLAMAGLDNSSTAFKIPDSITGNK